MADDRRPDGPFQKLANEQMSEALSKELLDFVTNFISRKLNENSDLGHETLSKRYAEHILARTGNEFIGTPEDLDRISRLVVTEEDQKELDLVSERIGMEISERVLGALTSEGVKILREAVESQWTTRRQEEQQAESEFRNRLQERWQEPLSLLKMLHSNIRDIGASYHIASAHDSRKLQRRVLFGLHGRACQVTGEIIVLLESGFADGAMARWRTLHEILVVTAIIANGDDNLARRYVDHSAVAERKSHRQYMDTYQALGYEPPTQSEIDKIERTYQNVMGRYGPSFGGDWGWAAESLGLKQPTFKDVEKAAGLERMRAHFGMASNAVHAGVRGIAAPLGLFEPWSIILAGASNAGLEEPGQNTAIYLMQVTAYALDKASATADEIVTIKFLHQLAIDAAQAFVDCARKLDEDERNIPRQS